KDAPQRTRRAQRKWGEALRPRKAHPAARKAAHGQEKATLRPCAAISRPRGATFRPWSVTLRPCGATFRPCGSKFRPRRAAAHPWDTLFDPREQRVRTARFDLDLTDGPELRYGQRDQGSQTRKATAFHCALLFAQLRRTAVFRQPLRLRHAKAPLG